MNIFWGIDTSCYTTSVAVLDEAGNLLADERRILAVKQGRRGLAQSEMVFQHVRNLPDLFAAAQKKVRGFETRAVGVSAVPRDVEGSYMPAFKVGTSLAQVLAQVNDVPLFQFSHQTGHIAAGLWSAQGPVCRDFLAFHISGGTTELLRVKENEAPFQVEIIAQTGDLHAGQFVDRMGVMLGLPFPAGPHLEKMASEAPTEALAVPVAAEGPRVSFSGPETFLKRKFAAGCPGPVIAKSVEICVTQTLAKALRFALENTEIRDVLMVGGVTANTFLRTHLISFLGEELADTRFYYPDPLFSRDNAVGIAYAALTKWRCQG